MADETKWIAVDVATPDATVWCLVSGDGAIACRGWNATKQQWEDWQGCQYPGLEMYNITHWRPLPDPPEPEERCSCGERGSPRYDERGLRWPGVCCDTCWSARLVLSRKQCR